MKKLFRTTTSFGILMMLFTALTTKAQTTDETLIFTTDKEINEEISFAVGTISNEGSVTIEGAEGSWVNDKTRTYTLTSKTVKITGDIGTFKCRESKIKTIDLSACTKLRMLDVDYNNIETFDFTNNPDLEKISFQQNKVATIDVSNCSKLKWLACSYNKLTEINTSANPQLDWLNCSGNQLSQVNINDNPMLTGLLCSNMNLERLDVAPCENLARLLCQNNKLSTLDISQNSKLTELQCFGNNLNELNTTNNPDLKTLNCSRNNIKTLNVSANPKLTTLSCFSNKLTTLDISACPDIKYLYCSGNEIKGTDMDNLISTMRYITEVEGKGTFGVIDNTKTPDKNECTKAQVALASQKGWTAKELKGKRWVDYEGSETTSISLPEADTNQPASIYDATGRRLSKPTRGLNIIKQQNGKSIKLISR